MNILCPVNKKEEITAVHDAGADEIYCGVMDRDWLKDYTNVASPNRREWKSSNLESFDSLRELIELAHSKNLRVFVTFNAFYTPGQMPVILRQIDRALGIGADALIVADPGLIHTLSKRRGVEFHISTGGTVFNSQALRFYKELGASRVILPRHQNIPDIASLAKTASLLDLKLETFILNRGCKNIDGFCTFHHGINEVVHGKKWDLFKKWNMDQRFLTLMRRFPDKIAQTVVNLNRTGLSDACFLRYDVKITELAESTGIPLKVIEKNISDNFNVLSGVDTCGACSLEHFKTFGITSVKIVGRSNLTSKKVKDVTFLKKVLTQLDDHEFMNLTRVERINLIKKIYKEIYGFSCNETCYYNLSI